MADILEIVRMNIKASGRAALIIAAGFCVWFASPVQAAEEADGVAVSQAEAAPGAPVALGKFRKSRHWKHASSHRKPVKVAQRVSAERGKTSEPKTPAEKKTVDLALKDDSAASLPSSVANAHAQLADADGSAGNAAALTSQARNRLQLMAASQPDAGPAQTVAADTELVAADQLNEVDRALSESKTADKAPAAAPATAVTQAPAVAAGTDDSTWGQASLIGKIFIAFGGLLTLASAARLFMA
jgi:hypothetical protein